MKTPKIQYRKITFLRPAKRVGGMGREVERVLPFLSEADAREWTRLQAKTAGWIVAKKPKPVERPRGAP